MYEELKYKFEVDFFKRIRENFNLNGLAKVVGIPNIAILAIMFCTYTIVSYAAVHCTTRG
jgi:hypothetical protein